MNHAVYQWSFRRHRPYTCPQGPGYWICYYDYSNYAILFILFSYSFILFYVIHANCVLCVIPWVGGVDVYTMCAVHRLSALVSWERL